MERQKHVAAIHDISGYGKCSLTVVLPILSAAGVQTSVMPTAILSTHTGVPFTGYTYRDLTQDLRPFANHWESLNLTFDAMYSGFLGSYEQISIVSDIFDQLGTKDTLIMVDPVMGDNGKLYATYTDQMAASMEHLCRKADIIVPNMTEAAFLTGEPYREGPYEKEYLEHLLMQLSKVGPKQVVITGVWFDGEHLGAACYHGGTQQFHYALAPQIPKHYPGTGDIFGSVLLACLLKGFPLEKAMGTAVDFTARSIGYTHQTSPNSGRGVNFEAALPGFMYQLGLFPSNT